MGELSHEDEVHRLRRSMSDLLGLVALPSVWTGYSRSQVVESVLEVLLGMLRLDFVYLKTGSRLEPRSETARFASGFATTLEASELSALLANSLGNAASGWPSSAKFALGDNDVLLACVPMGLQGEIGTIVAGARRQDFANDVERLLLGVAANQAAMAIQQLSALDGQKRLASDLDALVERRTAELAKINDTLKLEVLERQRTEHALRSSEQELRDTLDNIPTLVLLLTPSGRIELTNQEIRKFTNRTAAQLETLGFRDLLHPDDVPKAIERFERGLASEEPFDIALRIRAHDGVHRWFEGAYRPLRNSDGRVARWCVSFTDVDARQRVEDALREAELAWRSAIDGLPALVATLSPNGTIEAVNEQIVRYTGDEVERLVGVGADAIVHPDDRERVAELYSNLIAAGLPYEIELRLRRHDGIHRWFANRGTPARDASGNIVRWYILFVDIDEKRRSDQALRESEERARSIVDSIPAGIVTLEPTGEVTGANRQLLDYLGQSLEVIKQWDTNDLIHPDDAADLTEAFRAMIAAGEPVGFKVRLRRHDGAYRWFEVRNLPLRDKDGQIVRWYAVLTDVDDRERAENAVASSERELRLMLDSLASGIIAVSPIEGIVAANQQLLGYLGRSLDDLKHWMTTDMVHPDQFESTLTYFRTFMALGRYSEHETRIRRFDGTFRWFVVRNNPLLDADGQVVRWYGLLTDIDDRKRAEEALRESEAQLRLVVNTIPALVALFAPDGTAEEINEQFLEYLGETMDEFSDWPNNGTVHPDDVRHYAEVLSQSFDLGQPINTEARLRRFDGEYRWFQVRGLPSRNADGRIVRWYCLMSDIDDRKRAEEAVAASERDLKTTVDSIPAMAWSARADGFCDYFNQIYLEYTGRQLEEMQGWAWSVVVHPHDLANLVSEWRLALETNTARSIEARLQRADGQYRWFILRANPLLDEDGNVLKWYGLNTDIEDRKRAEDELSRSEASLAHSQRLSSMGSFAWILATYEFTHFSTELYRIFEIEEDVPITVEQIAARVHPDDVPLLTAKLELARAGIVDHNYDIRLRMPDGRVKYLRTESRAATQPDGQKIFVGTMQDITQRRVAEEAVNELRAELAHVSRVSMLGAMTASIAHEVNQPLSGIITNASTGLRMLASDPPDIQGARETARRTIRDGNRAAEVVSRLRALFSKKSEAAEVIDLNEAARDLIALAEAELRRSRTELQVDLAAELPEIMGDRVQLQQVVLNLLLNAADAVSSIEDRPRRVTLRTREDEDGNVRLTVQDTGVGIDPANMEKLFDAFYTTKPSGMGIGLSISRSIIEHHHGHIWAEPNIKAGATFSFAIPPARSISASDQPSR